MHNPGTGLTPKAPDLSTVEKLGRNAKSLRHKSLRLLAFSTITTATIATVAAITTIATFAAITITTAATITATIATITAIAAVSIATPEGTAGILIAAALPAAFAAQMLCRLTNLFRHLRVCRS